MGNDFRDCFFSPGFQGSVMTFGEAASSYIVRERGALVYEREKGDPGKVMREGAVVGNVLEERVLRGYVLEGRFYDQFQNSVVPVDSDNQVFKRKLEGVMSLSAFGQVEITLLK